MITHEGQLRLFQTLSNHLKKDVTCYAFGGTAMLFMGLKDETKDIDLLFLKPKERESFIDNLLLEDFEETTLVNIFIQEKLRRKDRPRMFQREDFRFDLFVKKIFETIISPGMDENLYAVQEFRGKKTLKLKVLQSEIIVMLKSVTERKRDFADIVNIIRKDKDFNWQYLIDEVKWQHEHGNSWVVLDIEKTMKALDGYNFIDDKYFKQLYKIL